MELKHKLEKIFNSDYPGTDRFIADVIVPIFGNEIEYINDDLAENEKYVEKAKNAGIKHIKYIGDLTEKNYNARNIALLDVTLDDSKNIERSRVNIQQLIRSIMDYRQHLMIVFHYENVANKQWRFSYAYKGDSLKDTTSAKRYTYVFGKGYRGRTAAERFDVLAKSSRNDEDFEKAFSVATLSDEFFVKYRDIYADFVQYITGKRYVKEKGKWEEKQLGTPNYQYQSTFEKDDKLVRDYIKKMFGRIVFLYFLQRKGWLDGNRQYMHDLFVNSDKKDDFSKPKIVYQELCRKGTAFAIDDKAMFLGNTGYILTSDVLSIDELGRLCELLNSAVSLYQLDVICTKFDETGWRWLRQFVECVKLPKSLTHWHKSFNFTHEEISFIASKYNHVLLD
ncbi:MAG: hypothetical protein HDS80_06440 [Bacteroidales bacterium]|nr:hypothetical protein [Bacteroidales bacterium]